MNNKINGDVVEVPVDAAFGVDERDVQQLVDELMAGQGYPTLTPQRVQELNEKLFTLAGCKVVSASDAELIVHCPYSNLAAVMAGMEIEHREAAAFLHHHSVTGLTQLVMSEPATVLADMVKIGMLIGIAVAKASPEWIERAQRESRAGFDSVVRAEGLERAMGAAEGTGEAN